jgi:oligoendopeptidase F
MQEMGHLDLGSRKSKAPGGYNYPLDETGVPFIFMNATTTLRDLVTMVHEGGHALHSFLTRDLPLNYFKHPPSEVAELASMSMELISMEHWDVFFSDRKDLNRAKREQLEGIISTLPWVATVDKFQNWIYENPRQTNEERKESWIKIYSDFSSNVTDWNGIEQFKEYLWQKQLHIYEVPFYYIEYGIAQLGAVAVWKNYRENPKDGLKKYLEALKLGYTRPISEIYETAGIRFDFSKEYIKELMDFVKKELDKCEVGGK